MTESRGGLQTDPNPNANLNLRAAGADQFWIVMVKLEGAMRMDLEPIKVWLRNLDMNQDLL